MRTRDAFVAGLIAGAVMGAFAILLIAPETGNEIRQRVDDRAGELWLQFRDWSDAENLTEELSDRFTPWDRFSLYSLR